MQKSVPNPFELQSHLDWLYQHKSSRFTLQSAFKEEIPTWQKSFREELRRLLGIKDRELHIQKIETGSSSDRGLFEEKQINLVVEEGLTIPIFLLIPKSHPPYPTILVFHGHDPSAQYCMGNYPDDKTRVKNLKDNNNYAQALAEAGFLVCVVEQRGMGSRVTRQVSTITTRSCRHLAFSYLLQGRTLLGERILDGMCVLSYLMSHPDVKGNPGCSGHSAGGTTALWLSALDDRVQSVVISGYFGTFKDSILAMEHCECNYVPGILELGEMGDLAALIAPRPLCIIHGEKDAIFPVESARTEFQKVEQTYTLIGEADKACLSIHPGGHAYDHQTARDWFAHWLV